MSNTNTGGPAFPQDYEHTKVLVQMQQVGDISEKQLRQLSSQLAGMTLRDYFAAKAMPFEFTDYWIDFEKREDKTIDEYWRFDIAESCYAMADAMLKARES